MLPWTFARNPLLWLSLLLALTPTLAFAGGGPGSLPEDQHVKSGVTPCIENIASCTDTTRMSQAWTEGMKEAQVSLDNLANYLWSLIRQQPSPTLPATPPGMPPMLGVPLIETTPAPPGSVKP